MADLFVSYSREDKARAEEIVRLLEDYGWDVFWDQETRSGTHWPKVLEEELGKARGLVALWTTTSVASRWVRIEAYEALQNEKLVPVLLDKVRPPLEFRQTQTFDLTGWNGDRDDARLAHLLADLTALAKAPGSHGGTSRPIKLVVPPTLQREKPATVKTPRSVPDAGLATMDFTTAGWSPRIIVVAGCTTDDCIVARRDARPWSDRGGGCRRMVDQRGLFVAQAG
jgi:hypothetical protein